MWRTAAAELRALQDPEAAAQSLKDEIGRIPLRGYQGQHEQANLGRDPEPGEVSHPRFFQATGRYHAKAA